jgi:hypothetical protein
MIKCKIGKVGKKDEKGKKYLLSLSFVLGYCILSVFRGPAALVSISDPTA